MTAITEIAQREVPNLSASETEGLFMVCLLAAFADGAKDEHERTALQPLAGTITHGQLHAAGALQKVMLGRVELADVTRIITAK